MTLANRITFFRLSIIPVFLVLIYSYTPDRDWMRGVALVVYILAGLSDILDGYVARHFNQQSNLGARLDPLADKLIINLGFVFLAANLSFNPGVPMWFPVIVLGRDTIIVIGAWMINEFFGPLKVKPRWPGKATTTAQISTLVGVLLGVWFVPQLLLITLCISLFSLTDYIHTGCLQAYGRDQA